MLGILHEHIEIVIDETVFQEFHCDFQFVRAYAGVFVGDTICCLYFIIKCQNSIVLVTGIVHAKYANDLCSNKLQILSGDRQGFALALKIPQFTRHMSIELGPATSGTYNQHRKKKMKIIAFQASYASPKSIVTA